MTTNLPGTQPPNRPSDQPATIESVETPVAIPTGSGAVAVFDQDGGTTNPSPRPSASMANTSVPAEVRSTGSPLTWIITAVVLIVLVYFLFQWIF